MTETVAHPWMANSVPALKAAMLAEIGAGSIEELFEQIPADHRLRAAAEPAAWTSLGGRPEAAPDLAAEPHRELRAESQFPRRRLLAAPRAGRRRRDRRPLRAAHQRLGLAAVRLRPQPGLVRVCQPAGRAGRHGGGLAAGLLLGLCRRPRHPHGRADHRPARGAAAARARPRAAGGDRQLLRAARDEPAHRHRRRSDSIRRRASSTSPTSSAGSRTGRPRSTSRARPTSA